MAVLTGRHGCVLTGDDAVTTAGAPNTTKIVDVTKWSMDRETEDLTYASCGTNGFRLRVAGIEDVSGVIEGVMDDTAPIETFLSPGQRVNLVLYRNRTMGHRLNVIILSVSEETDIEEGALTRWQANWANIDPTPQFNLTLPDHTTYLSVPLSTSTPDDYLNV